MTEEHSDAYDLAGIDRVGLAILAGGGLTGAVAMLLAIAGGERWPTALIFAAAIGAVVAMLGMVVLAGPIWFVLHRRHYRSPGAAATVAAVLATLVFTAAQMAGTGGGGYRLASALGTSLLIANAAAAIGIVMQGVAYRRLVE